MRRNGPLGGSFVLQADASGGQCDTGNAKKPAAKYRVNILQGGLSLLWQLCQLGLHLGQLKDGDERMPAVRGRQSIRQ